MQSDFEPQRTFNNKDQFVLEILDLPLKAFKRNANIEFLGGHRKSV